MGALAFSLTFFRLHWRAPHLEPRVPWSELAAALSSVRAGWLLAFVVVNLTSLPLRSLQLMAIARRGDGTAPRFAPCFRAVSVGVLTHMLLPARLGEATRALVLVRDGGVSLARSASALLVGRVFDLVAILVMSCALPLAARLPAAALPSLRAVTLGGSAIAAALLVLIAAVARWRRRERLPGVPATRIGRFALEFADGLSTVGDRRRLAVAIPSSLLVVVALAAALALAMRATGVAAPAGAALVLTGLFLVGVAVPGAPSSLGTYHAVVVFALAALGVPTPAALAFALVTHAAGTLANILVGVFAFATLRPENIQPNG